MLNVEAILEISLSRTVPATDIIGGPGACLSIPALLIFMIWCFGMTHYRGDGEARDCVIHAACNVMFILLVERSGAYEVRRLQRSITLASARCRHTSKEVLRLAIF